MLHDPGGLSLATQEPAAIQKMDNYYSDSNNTSSSSSSPSPLSKVPRVTSERSKTTTMTTITTHRRDRAKDLHRLNPPQLIDLVLRLESQLDKTETRLKKYVLRCKEHVESESQASEQAHKFRQKMTQVILDAQQEAAKAKQDVEEYKLRFENVQKELQRSRQVVQILENDKDEIQRALHRARDRAREYKERSAVQLAREQGRRAGFEQGLEQGRLAVQIAHARAAATTTTTTTTTSRTPPRRRALTQGTDGATTAPATPTTSTTRHRRRQSQPRSSLGSVQETREEPTPPNRPPSPTEQTTPQRSNNGPAAPPVQPIPPPAQQFPAGVPRDDVSEATTSPASTMTGMDILTFREPPVVSTSPTSSPERRRSRGGVQPSAEDAIRASTSGGHPPSRTVSGPPPAVSSAQQFSHPNPPGIAIEPPPSNPMPHPVQQQQQQPPPIVFPPDENLLTPTFLSTQTLPRSSSTNSVPNSNRSSLSVDIHVEPPSQPSTPRENDESSGQDRQFLTPDGSRPISLPQVQPQPRVIQPHESPVLPVLPRIVSRPTTWGTPAVVPLDIPGGHPNTYNSSGHDVYEEAPTPPGFRYPAPLGAAISGGPNVVNNGKGKGKSVTLPAGGGSSSSSSSYYASSPYVSKPDSSSASSSQQPIVPPVTPKTSSLSSSSSTSSSTSSSQQPVVPPVAPSVGIYQGNGYHRNERDDYEEEDSFDSATKRNTQWNSRLYRQGKWGE